MLKNFARAVVGLLLFVGLPAMAQTVNNITTGNSPYYYALPTLSGGSAYAQWFCKADTGTGVLHIQSAGVDVVAIGVPKQCNLIRWSGTTYQNLSTSGGGGGSGPVTSVNGFYGDVVLGAANVGAQPLDSNLTALSGTSAGGIVVQTGAGAFTRRSLVNGTGTSVVNGSGIGGSLQVNLTSTIPAAGPIGDASHVPTLTYDATGRLTAVTSTLITPSAIGAAPAGSYQPAGSYVVTTNNLSDLGNLATAQTNLGLAIGTNVEAWDADLDSIAALSTQTFGRSLLTYSTAPAALSALGGVGSVSPAFTGTPTAPTAAASTSTTQLATTAFTANAITAAATNYLSSSTTSTQSGYFFDTWLKNTTSGFYLALRNGDTTATASRALTFNINNSGRVVNLSGNLTLTADATISGTNTGDQTTTSLGALAIANNLSELSGAANAKAARANIGVSSLNTSVANANTTVAIGAGNRILQTTALTANRTLGLLVANANPGDTIEYRRTGSDTFLETIQDFNTTTTLGTCAVNITCRAMFNGTAWVWWGASSN